MKDQPREIVIEKPLDIKLVAMQEEFLKKNKIKRYDHTGKLIKDNK